MIKFRPIGMMYHTLDESLEHMSEFETIEEMLNWIVEKSYGLPNLKVIINETVDYDKRCDWYAQNICIYYGDNESRHIGYCDLGAEGENYGNN